jgi:D-tyrosyl-tRNA(Tyr) deacylase
MRAIIQRVSFAKVESEGEVLGEISRGLLLLLGITHDDGPADIEWLAKKALQLRIFSDEAGKMNLSVGEAGGGLLVVSQFTLYADSRKGNRPSFTRSAPPSVAQPLYEQFLRTVRQHFSGPLSSGRFGADMQVSLLNDGPVTILLDTREG